MALGSAVGAWLDGPVTFGVFSATEGRSAEDLCTRGAGVDGADDKRNRVYGSRGPWQAESINAVRNSVGMGWKCFIF